MNRAHGTLVSEYAHDYLVLVAAAAHDLVARSDCLSVMCFLPFFFYVLWMYVDGYFAQYVITN